MTLHVKKQSWLGPYHVVACLLATIPVFAGPSACHAQEKEKAEEVKRRALEKQTRDNQPQRPVADPEAERRKALEREAPTERPSTGAAGAVSDEELKANAPQGDPRDSRRELIDAHDWDAQFQRGGAVANELQLALAAPQDPYRFGPPYYLYLGLENRTAQQRTIDAMPACGSLARTDSLVFRVRSDDGTEIVSPNRYSDNQGLHAHPALGVEPNGRLADVVDFSGLVAASGELFDLVKRSKRLVITAEVAGLRLSSNQVKITLQRN